MSQNLLRDRLIVKRVINRRAVLSSGQESGTLAGISLLFRRVWIKIIKLSADILNN
jgi:hypothetical protein